jgi:4-amino-4-deoxy-L-arabinose transferase-like glycosyltransferase
VPLGLAVLVILTSIYSVEPVAWVQDTYERLIDAERILSGELPSSKITAPGGAITLLPFFLLLPHSVETIQIASGVFNLALVVFVYIGLMKLTNERFVALFVSIGCALTLHFVILSRSAMFDTAVAFLVVLSILSIPWLKRISLLSVLVAYGLLLALIVAIRPLNIIVLIPIAFYWLTSAPNGKGQTEVLKDLFSKRVSICLITLTIATMASILAGDWFGNASGAPLTLVRAPDNLLYYLNVLFFGPWGVIFLAPAAFLGGGALWRANRPLLYAAVALLCSWVIAFTPFYFVSARYML